MLGMKALIRRRIAPGEPASQRPDVIRIRELSEALAESRRALDGKHQFAPSYTETVARWTNDESKNEKCFGLRSG